MGTRATEVSWGLWKVLSNSEEMGFILPSRGKPIEGFEKNEDIGFCISCGIDCREVF